VAFFAIALAAARAQGNYEVQVYGSDLVPPHNTMVELHSNFTVQGSKTIIDGMLPTEHQEHETLEITHGWNDWFETGLYQFTDHQPSGGWMWVGTLPSAGGNQPVDRDRLSARHLLRRYLDLGNPPHRG
jgi:hypothetical protein